MYVFDIFNGLKHTFNIDIHHHDVVGTFLYTIYVLNKLGKIDSSKQYHNSKVKDMIVMFIEHLHN